VYEYKIVITFFISYSITFDIQEKKLKST